MSPADRLTPREHDVLNGLAEGLRVKEIAAKLGLSDNTIKNHKRLLFAKLGASSTIEALRAVKRLR